MNIIIFLIIGIIITSMFLVYWVFIKKEDENSKILRRWFGLPVDHLPNEKFTNNSITDCDDLSTIDKIIANPYCTFYHSFNDFYNIKIEDVLKRNIKINDTVITTDYIKGKIDAFIKFFGSCSLKYETYDCILGMYAIRCLYLKLLDHNWMNLYLSPEIAFAKYIRNTIFRLDEITQLDLQCIFSEDNRILYV